ncbi:MAG: response regulator [Candidatus Aminicenantes bacterium]|nr:response regulator [Candidatus Aminicenantes bacterium]
MQNKKNILVIDDEPDIRDLLKDHLEDNNFTVNVVDDGAEALEFMERNIPDLVITDLLLPGEHGIDLIKIIKEKFFLPVIVISGIYRTKEVTHVIKEDLIEAFFEKPLNLDTMLEKINLILNG